MTDQNITKQIPLTQGKFAIVDDEDFEYLMQWKWCFNGKYAVRIFNSNKSCGKRTTKTIRMHREINKTPDGLQTDHINQNKLDNQKHNLRDCTRSQNTMNRKSYKNSSSKYKGVCWNKSRENWIVYISINKKHIYLGNFTSEIEAAEAYNNAALKYHGEFAKLNDIIF